MSKLEFGWRNGYRTSKLGRLHRDAYQRRIANIARHVRTAAQAWSIPDYESARMMKIRVDLTKRGNRRGLSITEQMGMVEGIELGLMNYVPAGIKSVHFHQTQAASMHWTKEQRKNHLRVGRRIRKSRPGMAKRMLRQSFGPHVTVELL